MHTERKWYKEIVNEENGVIRTFLVCLFLFIFLFGGALYCFADTAGYYTGETNGAGKMLYTSHWSASSTASHSFSCGANNTVVSIRRDTGGTNVAVTSLGGGAYYIATSSLNTTDSESGLYFLNVAGALTDWAQVQDCGSTVYFTGYMPASTSSTASSTAETQLAGIISVFITLMGSTIGVVALMVLLKQSVR